MTYEERERQICRECSEKEICPYIPRKMEYKCQHLSDTMYGWQLGHKDAIESLWHNAPQELPDCDCICVTDNGYSYSINMWDTYHNCWDDADGDDFAMSANTELKWIPLEKEDEE